MPHLRVAAAVSAAAAAHAALQKPQKCSTGDRLLAILAFLPVSVAMIFCVYPTPDQEA